MIEKCPECGKEGKSLKQWSYGPKTRKGPSFDVMIFQCDSGHKWRKYYKKQHVVQTPLITKIKSKKRERYRKGVYAFVSDIDVCPPNASFIAKPSMPAMQATVASGTLMFSGAEETAMQVSLQVIGSFFIFSLDAVWQSRLQSSQLLFAVFELQYLFEQPCLQLLDTPLHRKQPLMIAGKIGRAHV